MHPDRSSSNLSRGIQTQDSHSPKPGPLGRGRDCRFVGLEGRQYGELGLHIAVEHVHELASLDGSNTTGSFPWDLRVSSTLLARYWQGARQSWQTSQVWTREKRFSADWKILDHGDAARVRGQGDVVHELLASRNAAMNLMIPNKSGHNLHSLGALQLTTDLSGHIRQLSSQRYCVVSMYVGHWQVMQEVVVVGKRQDVRQALIDKQRTPTGHHGPPHEA
jgi:hypothetical protein